MKSATSNLEEFKTILKNKNLSLAYKTIIDFTTEFRTNFSKAHPDYKVPSHFHQGVLDYTLFAITHKTLANKKLKVPIVFNYQEFSFSIYLSGINKKEQIKYWVELSKIENFPLKQSPDATSNPFIVQKNIDIIPDFNNQENLAQYLEKEIIAFNETIILFF